MEKKTQSYQDLVIRQKGIALARAVYKQTGKFPSEEKFCLISQMRRAAIRRMLNGLPRKLQPSA